LRATQSRAAFREIPNDTSIVQFRDDRIDTDRSIGEFVCIEASTGTQV
jgi:hypothetical protein